MRRFIRCTRIFKPGTSQLKKTQWLSTYPSPLKIELDFTSSYGGHYLEAKNLQNALENDNISIHTANDSYHHLPWIQSYLSSNRLTLAEHTRHDCCIS